MPITMTPGDMKYRDENGVYHDLNYIKGDVIDDTAGAGDTDVTFSADKLTTDYSNLSSEINGIEESIAPVESSATATSAHAVGELFILNDQLLVALSAIAIGDTITTMGLSPNAAVTKLSEKMIKDVQVAGSSVLTNGVANIPIASTGGVKGAVTIDGTYGVSANVNGRPYVQKAADTKVKKGTEQYQPVVPEYQHISVFYGLSKVAGENLGNDTVTLGTYPEKSLSAISNMLNAPVSVSGTTPSFTAKSGVRYICGECSTLTITAPASGCIDVTFVSGSTPTVLTVSSAKANTTIKWANGFDPTSLDANTTYEINILDGEFGVVGSWT